MVPPKILFLVPYPLRKAPSQRFRVEAFFPLLQENRFQYKVKPFLSNNAFNVLYEHSSFATKVSGVIRGFLSRIKTGLFTVHSYDYIFIHREAAPIGPPIFEFIISKIWGKKIIYDFDDAIWIPNTTKENKMINWVKAFWKVKWICKWSYKVVGGNDFLCEYARKYNPNVILIPTCVDVVKHHNKLKEQQSEQIILGWTGSHSTLAFLDPIVPALKRIIEELNVELHIICNKPPGFSLPNMHYIKWTEKREIQDLLGINIGLMPLEKDPWCEGKCGFKLIQYLSLGIPAVASPVGVNKDIVQNGVHGILCSTDEEWYTALKALIQDCPGREAMGKNGRDLVEKKYSIQATAGSFLELFN